MEPLIRYIPWNGIAAVADALAHLRIPSALRPLVFRSFAKLYGISLSEVELPLTDYTSFSRFFTRRLRAGLRQFSPTLYSPVDGTLRNVSRISAGRIPQIKGRDYGLQEFVGPDIDASPFLDGVCVNLYLSPANYHRVHVPCALRLCGVFPIPGAIFPVNDWSIANVPELFAKNRRVVFSCSSQEYGDFLLVMVGAANVGRILVHEQAGPEGIDLFDPSSKALVSKLYREFSVGQELATFDLGSSVVLLFPPGESAEGLLSNRGRPPGPIRLGDALIAPSN